MHKQRKFSNQLFLVLLLILPTISFAVDSYDPETGVVHMPVVNVGTDMFDVYMQHQGDLVFQVTLAKQVFTSSALPDLYDANEGSLYIPSIMVGADIFEVTMQHQGDLLFTVESAKLIVEQSNANPSASDGLLNGTVWSQCTGGAIMARTYYNDNKFAWTLEYYSNSDCTGDVMLDEIYLLGGDEFDRSKIEWTGVVEIGESFISTSGIEAKKVNLKYYYEMFDIFYIQDDVGYLGISSGVFNENQRDVELDFNSPWTINSL